MSQNRFQKKFQDFFSHEEPEHKEVLNESKNEIIHQYSFKDKALDFFAQYGKILSKILAAIIVLPLVIMLILSLLVNNNVLKNNLQITLDKKIEGDFFIQGDVKTRFLPTPKIVINQPILKNANYEGQKLDISMESMVINVGFFSLFSGTPKISEIHFISPVINYGFADKKIVLEVKPKTAEDTIDANNTDVADPATENLAEKIVKDAAVNPPIPTDQDFETQAKDQEKSPLEEQDLADAAIDESKSPLEENDLEAVKEAEKNPTKQKPTIDKLPNETANLTYDHSSLTSRIFQFDNDEGKVFDIKTIPLIEVEKGSFKKTGLGGETILDIKNINFISKSDIASQNLDIAGEVFFNNTPTQFNLVLNVDSDSQLTINSTIFQLKLEGEFFDSNLNDLAKANFSGKIEATIFSPKDLVNKYISKYSLFYGRIGTNTEVKVAAQINADKGNYKISGITVNSPILMANGEADINLSGARTEINSKIDIRKIDLDNIWSSRFSDYSKEIVKFEGNLIDDFLGSNQEEIDEMAKLDELNAADPSQLNQIEQIESVIIDEKLPVAPVSNFAFKNVDLNIAIKATNAKYHQKEINNASLNLTTSQEGNLQINQARMTIPDGGIMELSGDFQNQDNISSFIGSYKIDGKDFNDFISWLGFSSEYLAINQGVAYAVSGKIMALSNFSGLKDVEINVENGRNIINGKIRYDSSKDIETVDADFSISELNVEDYFNISLERNPYVSPGYLSQKFLWLNTIATNNNIAVNIGKLQYHDQLFLDQAINFTIKPSYVSLDNIYFKSEDGSVDMKISTILDLTAKPNLLLDVEINNFSYNSGDLEDNKKFKRLPFSERFFLLPTLADFDGKISIKSNRFFINNIEIFDVVLAGDLKQGIFNIKDGTLNIHEGNLTYNGEVVLRKVKSVNGQFVLTEVNNKKLLSNLFGIKNIGGISNIAGIFNANGQNIEGFVKSIDTKLQFVSINSPIENFGLNELLKQMLIITRSKGTIADPQSLLFNEKYQTTFKDMKGTFELSDNKNLLRISSSAPGINGVTTGSINFPENSLNLSSQIIFLSGTRSKQIPINIIIANSGNMEKLENTANLSQVDQYISQVQQRNVAQ